MSALLKTIQLYPTSFHCDIWICEDSELLDECFLKRYGIPFIDETLTGDACCEGFCAKEDSEVGSIKTIYMAFPNRDSMSNMVHESVHVLDTLAHWTNLGMGYESREWKAYFIEYVFAACADVNGFEEYNIANRNTE